MIEDLNVQGDEARQSDADRAIRSPWQNGRGLFHFLQQHQIESERQDKIRLSQCKRTNQMESEKHDKINYEGSDVHSYIDAIVLLTVSEGAIKEADEHGVDVDDEWQDRPLHRLKRFSLLMNNNSERRCESSNEITFEPW